MAATFELREHTADVAVAARGESLGEAFAAVGDGLAAAMCDDWPTADEPDGGERATFSLTAEGVEAALFDYLDQLIYERDVRSVLPVDNEVRVTETGQRRRVEAGYRGVPLSAVTAREIKAVTYSEMSVQKTPAGWEAYVVFDV